MRAALVALGLVGLLAAGVAAGDLVASSWIGLAPGSSAGTRPDDLRLLPEDCEDDPCERVDAFRPDTTMLVVTSVPNDGPVPITLNGVAEQWLEDASSSDLARPVGGLDGGDTPGLEADRYEPFGQV